MRKSPILLVFLVIVSCFSEQREYRIDDRVLVTLEDRTEKMCVGLTLTDSNSTVSSLRLFEESEIRHWGLQGAHIDLRPAAEIDNADIIRTMEVLRLAGVWKISLLGGSCVTT